MKKILLLALLISLFSVVSWASGLGGGYVNVYYSTSTAHNNFSNLEWTLAGHIMDDTLTDNFGLNTTTLTVSGISTMGGTITETYGLATATLAVSGLSTFANTITESKGINTSTITVTGASILAGAITAGGTITETYGIQTATAVVSGTAILQGAITAGDTITETYGISVATLVVTSPTGFSAVISSIQTGAYNNIIISSIQAGAYNNIIVSSYQAGVVANIIVSSIQAGTPITAASIMAGSLASTVIVSSIQSGAYNNIIISSMQAGIPIIFGSGRNVTAGTYTIAVSTDVNITGVTTSSIKVVAPKFNLNTAYELGVDTPTETGTLSRNAAFVLYISTGTNNCYDYIKVGAQ